MQVGINSISQLFLMATFIIKNIIKLNKYKTV